MNARAHDLVVILRGLLGMLPGATAITLHTFTTWTYVLIAASTDAADAAVRMLGHDLGLGAPEIRAARTSTEILKASIHGGPISQSPLPLSGRATSNLMVLPRTDTARR